MYQHFKTNHNGESGVNIGGEVLTSRMLKNLALARIPFGFSDVGNPLINDWDCYEYTGSRVGLNRVPSESDIEEYDEVTIDYPTLQIGKFVVSIGPDFEYEYIEGACQCKIFQFGCFYFEWLSDECKKLN